MINDECGFAERVASGAHDNHNTNTASTAECLDNSYTVTTFGIEKFFVVAFWRGLMARLCIISRGKPRRLWHLESWFESIVVFGAQNSKWSAPNSSFSIWFWNLLFRSKVAIFKHLTLISLISISRSNEQIQAQPISEKTYTRWRCYQYFTKVIMEDW